MILQKELINDSLVLGEDIKSYKATVDESDIKHIMWVLSSSLYSDAIGSMIREIVSNAYDAHIESKNTEDNIIIDFTDNILTIKDFGTGLSPEKINNVYRKFGKSTKRDSNEAIGSFGIGKYSVFSYTDMYYIETVVDNILYKYILNKESGIPEISLLTETVLEEETKNYTSVIIPTKRNDSSTIYNKVQEQTFLFDRLSYLGMLSNIKVESIKGKHCIFCENYSPDGSTGILLAIGKVFYKVPQFDYNIRSDWFNPRIILRFEIGELPVTPNREGIVLNDTTKEIIREKWKLAIEELYVKFLQKDGEKVENLAEYIKALDNYHSAKLSINIKDKVCLGVERTVFNRLGFKISEPIYNYNINKNYRDLISKILKQRVSFYSWSYTNPHSKHATSINFEDLPRSKPILFHEPLRKRDFDKVKELTTTINHNRYNFAYLNNLDIPYSKKHFINTIQNYFYENKNSYRAFKEFLEDFDDYILSNVIPIESLPEPKKEVKIKREAERKVTDEKFLVKLARRSDKGDKYTVFESNYFTSKEMTGKNNGTFIYGTEDQKDKLGKIYELINTVTRCFSVYDKRSKKLLKYKVFLTNEKNFEKFKHLKNVVNVGEVFINVPRAVRNIVAATKFRELKNNKYPAVFSNLEHIRDICVKDFEKLEEINVLINTFASTIPKEFYEIDLDPKHKAMLKDLEELGNVYQNFEHLKKATNYSNIVTKESIPFFINFLKGIGKRVDYTHYNLSKNENI